MKHKIIITTLFSMLCMSSFAENSPSLSPEQTTANALQAPPAPEPEHISTIASAPKSAPVINCEYLIPSTTTVIDQSLLSTWAEKATIQMFDFNPADLESQLDKLKPCFTDQGWISFKEALDSSGNIEAIKLQNLTVSSQLDGPVSINPSQENQWKINVPLQVVYQNDKEKLTQLLSIDLLVGRRMQGNLGIMQILATPREATIANP